MNTDVLAHDPYLLSSQIISVYRGDVACIPLDVPSYVIFHFLCSSMDKDNNTSKTLAVIF